MSDEITITLPVSGKEVVIRNYTTRADDIKAEEALFRGVESSPKDKDGKVGVKFPIANIMESTAAYVRRLVRSIDGNDKNIALALEELRSEDYAYIEQQVDTIVEEHSPKAQKAVNV